jgi:oxygen-independent coproporphyrinogen III oxidase
MEPVAVYVHTPFCPTKCGYCDFNSYAMEGEIMARTTSAMIQEIERSPWRGTPAKTIFFGGGTPTYLPSSQLIQLLQTVMAVHPPVEGCEITSEANPGTVDAEKFGAMREAGFNRISLGAQSFFDSDLLTLGRIHQAGHIEKAVKAAREAGFENMNVDLMFALPGQSQKAWEHNLQRAIDLGTDHLSLYGLTLEPNTPFYKQHLKGQLTLPEEEDQVRMYNASIARTAEAGFTQYEISNFAKPGRECLHNLCYWHNEHYAGYGPGAVGFMNGRRYTNLKHPDGYCRAVETDAPVWFEEERLSEENQRMERLMLGLRLNEGLDISGLRLDLNKLKNVVDRGWLARDENRLKLTDEGRHFCSEVTLMLA